MNGMTKQIAEQLNISLQDALKVQDYIDNNWLLNWSEDSKRKINNTIKAVAAVLFA